MVKIYLITIALLTITLSCFSQNADELNRQAYQLLSKKDSKNAFSLWKQAAEMGHPEAQYNYGYCFEKGIETEKNDSIANVWYLKSALQGFADAQFKVAFSYAKGRGVKQNDKQAFYWSIKCADQNDVECIQNVAFCYFNGIGTNKNIDSVLFWTCKIALLTKVKNLHSAEMITSARLKLAIDFKDGNNFPKDYFKSYMWFLIYNENKINFFSKIEQESNIKFIKEIEKKLSNSEREMAKVEAEKLMNQKLANFDNLYRVEN